MHRFFALLALTAAALGIWLLLSGPDLGSGGAGSAGLPSPVAYTGWAAGLLVGISLAWLARVDWRELPARITTWVKLQRCRLGWALVGSVGAAILLLF